MSSETTSKLSIKRCFRPQYSSMAEFLELSRESVRQEEMQQKDDKITPYEIFMFKEGEDYEKKLPKCLTAADNLSDEKSLDKIVVVVIV